MKKRIYSVLVENRSGVLGKVAGLFARRCFNIDSLVVGETDNSDVSCMTIVSSGDERTIGAKRHPLSLLSDVRSLSLFFRDDELQLSLQSHDSMPHLAERNQQSR